MTDKVPLCPAEPDLLVLQHVDDVPEAELTDEREPGKFVKVFAVRDCLPEFDGVTVFGDKRMNRCFGRAEDEHEVTGLHVEQEWAVPVPACLQQPNPDVADELVAGVAASGVVIGDAAGRWGGVLHFPVHGGRLVLPSAAHVDLRGAFFPRQQLSWEEGTVPPRGDPEAPEDLASKSLCTKGSVQQVREPVPWVQGTEHLKDFPGDHVLARLPDDHRALQLALPGGVTETPALAVEFNQHSWPPTRRWVGPKGTGLLETDRPGLVEPREPRRSIRGPCR